MPASKKQPVLKAHNQGVPTIKFMWRLDELIGLHDVSFVCSGHAAGAALLTRKQGVLRRQRDRFRFRCGFFRLLRGLQSPKVPALVHPKSRKAVNWQARGLQTHPCFFDLTAITNLHRAVPVLSAYLSGCFLTITNRKFNEFHGHRLACRTIAVIIELVWLVNSWIAGKFPAK